MVFVAGGERGHVLRQRHTTFAALLFVDELCADMRGGDKMVTSRHGSTCHANVRSRASAKQSTSQSCLLRRFHPSRRVVPYPPASKKLNVCVKIFFS